MCVCVCVCVCACVRACVRMHEYFTVMYMCPGLVPRLSHHKIRGSLLDLRPENEALFTCSRIVGEGKGCQRFCLSGNSM